MLSQCLRKSTVIKAVRRSLTVRSYSLCCPPRPPCGCSPTGGSGPKIEPPAHCRPGPVPYNPCHPQHHHGKDTWRKYKYLALFICFPLIGVQTFHCFNHTVPHKTECRDYAYMRRRTKRFPWGSGQETFFHNEHVNHLPGECVPPPLDCD